MDEKRNEQEMLADVTDDVGMSAGMEDQEDQRIHRALADYKARFFEALEKLSDDQRALMEYRYNITDGNLGEVRTLEETAKKFGVTREKVRRADYKLRRIAVPHRGCSFSRLRSYKDYL